MNALEAIRRRRSVARLGEPGPDEEQLRQILAAAACAPDHEELRPWRFVVLLGEEKDAFGEVLVSALLHRAEEEGWSPTEGQISKERTKFNRAPVVVAFGCVPKAHKIPAHEQLLSTAAAAENALIAATALGFHSIWRTGQPAYDPVVKTALGLEQGDSIVGWLYIGTAKKAPEERAEPNLDGLVTYWRPEVPATV